MDYFVVSVSFERIMNEDWMQAIDGHSGTQSIEENPEKC